MFELADAEVGQLVAFKEEGFGLVDDGRVAVEGRVGIGCDFRRGIMQRGNVGECGPLRVAVHARESLVAGVDEGEETIGSLLSGILVRRLSDRQYHE